MFFDYFSLTRIVHLPTFRLAPLLMFPKNMTRLPFEAHAASDRHCEQREAIQQSAPTQAGLLRLRLAMTARPRHVFWNAQ
jgi:hypothetical protein